MRLCTFCKKLPPSTPHPNSKYCHHCREKLRRTPFPHGATPEQIALVRKLSPTLYKHEICAQTGMSWSMVHRIKFWFGIKENARDYSDALVEKVCRYYARHGKVKTQKKFPDVRIRSIVERYYRNIGRNT